MQRLGRALPGHHERHEGKKPTIQRNKSINQLLCSCLVRFSSLAEVNMWVIYLVADIITSLKMTC